MSISFQTNDEILTVTVEGMFCFDDVIETRDKAVEIINKKKIYRELIDVRNAKLWISQSDIYSFIKSFFDYYPPNTKHAYVYSQGDYDPDLITLSQNVALNSGINAKWFTNMQEALDWLVS